MGLKLPLDQSIVEVEAGVDLAALAVGVLGLFDVEVLDPVGGVARPSEGEYNLVAVRVVAEVACSKGEGVLGVEGVLEGDALGGRTVPCLDASPGAEGHCCHLYVLLR